MPDVPFIACNVINLDASDELGDAVLLVVLTSSRCDPALSGVPDSAIY